jgi:DNA (cytosine-5)-methyltransferase 1
MTQRSKRPLRLVSLYTGAGGMDYGFEAAGFETTVAIEMDRACCQTLRANRPWPVVEKNIHDVSSAEILSAAALRPGEVDLLIGGPPCQPFSKSAYWVNGDTRRLDDPRALTLHEYMRCVEDLLPEVFVLENVYGISYSGKEEGFHFLEREIARINKRQRTQYVFSWQVVRAVSFGVPQIRERFFLVAHRGGKYFDFPDATHGEDNGAGGLFDEALAPFATAWDAIGDMTPNKGEDLRVRGSWADLLPSIPEGENYLWHTPRKGGLPLFAWRSRYWSFLLKLAKSKPSWTIQAQPGPAIGPFHWTNRLLSVREMARLQTFPDDVIFAGSRVAVQRQIGNAVPSLITEILGRSIAAQFFGSKPLGGLKLAVPARRPIPPAEKVGPVPTRFKPLPPERLVETEPRYVRVKRERKAQDRGLMEV